MRVRTVIYFVIVVLLAILAIANWTSLMTTVEVNLILTRTFIPAAVLLLSLIALVVLIDWSVHAAHHLDMHRRLRALDAEIERLRSQIALQEGTDPRSWTSPTQGGALR
jgi:uncharacterized membrane protein YciS (DUF1049 family)